VTLFTVKTKVYFIIYYYLPSAKRVLAYRGVDHFDVLPEGWVEITHASGLPVYFVSE
jgi:hypothetical protein